MKRKPHAVLLLLGVIPAGLTVGCDANLAPPEPDRVQGPEQEQQADIDVDTSRGTFQTMQPNGAIIELLRPQKDYYTWFMTPVGYTAVHAGKEGGWQYAELAADGSLVPSGAVIGADDPPGPKGIFPGSDVIAALDALAARGPTTYFVEPEELPEDIHSVVELIEGDILIPKDQRDVQGIYYAGSYWPGGVVVYTLNGLDSTMEGLVLDAMTELESIANVTFVGRTAEANYVEVIQNGGGNWSYIGMLGGKQQLSMTSYNKYVACHELMHALGIWHEQSRGDRDSYVQINSANITSGYEGNFLTYPSGIIPNAYDFDAVMHYPKWAFTNNGQDTITCLPPYEAWQDLIGQRDHLSVGDAVTVAAIYGTPNPSADDVYITTDEDSPFSGTLSASDPDSLPLTFSIVNNGNYGTAVITNATTGDYTYTPNAGSNGNIDTFTFKASASDSGVSLPATVTVAIFDGLISPADGAELSSTSQVISWKSVAGATQYNISAGSTIGGTDYYDDNVGQDLTTTITGLPDDGSTVHLRLAAQVAGNWQTSDYTYEAYNILAEITSPPDGSTLADTTVTFQWTAGTGVSEYWLQIGSAPGGLDLYDASLGSNQSATVNNLPSDGGQVYVRLYSKIGSNWPSIDYTYTAYTMAPPTMTPADGSTLSGATETFSWTEIGGATEYWLRAETSIGALDLHNAGTGSSRTQAVSGIPTDGSTIYVSLWGKIGNDWGDAYDFSYTTASGGSSAGGPTITPADGSTLSGASETFSWTEISGAAEYWLRVETSIGALDIFNASTGSQRNQDVSSIPTDGSTIYVRLWARIGSDWGDPYDYSYTAENSSGDGGPTITPADGSALSGAGEAFSWTPVSGADEYWLRVETSFGALDIFNASTGAERNQVVSGIPTDGSTIYVRLWARIGSDWGDPYDFSYTADNSGGSGAPTMTPADGSTLSGATVTFSWTAVSGSAEYWLRVGTAIGALDIFDGSTGTNQSHIVPGLPIDGSTVYVRLWARSGNDWGSAYDYSYMADNGSGFPTMTPAGGSTLNGPTQTFSWTAIPGATEYWLRVETTPGALDIFNASTGAVQSQQVTGLPTNGSKIFVSIMGRVGGNWEDPYDYTYTTVNGGGSGLTITPAEGSTLSGSGQTFSWTAVSGANEYWLRVETAQGAMNIVNTSTGTARWVYVSGLPTNGSTVYVSLWAKVSGTWGSAHNYSFNAASSGGGAPEVSPADGSTLSGTSTTFSWPMIPGAQEYWLRVETSIGALDIYDQSTGTSRSELVSGIPTDGGTIYVRLWARIGSNWGTAYDYSYAADN